MNTEIWCKFPKDLMSCYGFLSKSTGELVSLTPLTKLIYVHMLSKNEFFVGKLDSVHYETQQTIADACNSEYQAAGKAVRLFMEHNILFGSKKRHGGSGQFRWNYKIIDTSIRLVKKVGNDFICIDTGQILVKKNVEVKDKKGNISNVDKFFVDSGYETVDTVQTQEDVPPRWCTEPVDVYHDNIYIDFVGNN